MSARWRASLQYVAICNINLTAIGGAPAPVQSAHVRAGAVPGGPDQLLPQLPHLQAAQQDLPQDIQPPPAQHGLPGHQVAQGRRGLS